MRVRISPDECSLIESGNKMSMSKSGATFLVAATCALISGCDVSREYREEVLLSDGSTILATVNTVVGPDEFLIPGNGRTQKVKISFQMPGHEVVWPGTTPESMRVKPPHVFPLAFDMLGSAPVVVIAVVSGQCHAYGSPPDSLVGYAFDGTRWNRIPDTSINLQWRANFIGEMNNKFLRNGHTYSAKEIAQSVLVGVDPDDYSKSITLDHKVEDLRQMGLLCSQIRS